MPRGSHPGGLIQVAFTAWHYPKTVVNPGWSLYVELTYSTAVRAGDALFIAGMAALDPATGNAVHAGDIAMQAACATENICPPAAPAGGGPEHLAKPVESAPSAALRVHRQARAGHARLLPGPY